ncbi:NAD(P)H-dependent oxidoreductase [uncultured Bacteroides sp.]|uniref:NAD(P)H-dependent oxidoreductase n=1 Tax=uncultured Bacteroides sp. TaxID=162156 RepID=UPI0023C2D129|nr:NAD(P)H-dependent oxidoreductase [uncultured Bacteroides sp.]MDE6172019.1 NAD(P)H-dependent oxidoreductase [Bacteroides sp.]
MDRKLKKVVVLLAHPNLESSRANMALFEAIKEIEEVAVYNLYEMPAEDVFNIDEWSRIISHATAVVYQFPLHWMSAPYLLKQWQDEVFTHLAKTPAVAGKPLMIATTTGSDFEAYRSGGRNRFTVDELLRPYQAGAIHASMQWQTPFVIYGIGTSDTERNLAKGVDCYKKKLIAFVGKDKTEDVW